MVEQAYVNKLLSFEQSLKELTFRIVKIEEDMKYTATDSSVKVLLKDSENAIQDNSDAIAKLQNQLVQVQLPDDTKYYLNQTEVEEFRKNYKQILAMLADIDEKYKALVAYTVN